METQAAILAGGRVHREAEKRLERQTGSQKTRIQDTVVPIEGTRWSDSIGKWYPDSIT